MTIRFASVHLKYIRTAAAFLLAFVSLTLSADHTPDPASVTVAGSLQSELGCPGDWQPDCAVTHLAYDAEDDVWQGVFNVPAGLWEYKAPLNDSWEENYGAGATRDGPNIPLSLGAATDVKFYYDHKAHWITDNINSVIAVAPGSFQSELGCSGDWQPWCLRSWLQDPDGDEVFVFETDRLPVGDYEAKVAHDESWDENYGAGGVQNGPNIPFNVPQSCADMRFEYQLSTHVLTVSAAPAPAQPATVGIPGSFQEELGCPGDWQPDCAVTHLGFDAEDTVWQGIYNIPAGDWEYKAALNDSWDVHYGANATQNGPNIGLSLGAPTDVRFYYSHETNWVTSNQNAVIATLPGSFQSELGCSGDWQPWCLRSWLQDPDGDGIYTFLTGKLPAGNYEVKVAHNESWDENYGADGVQNGPNIPFTVPQDCSEVFFTYDPVTHILDIGFTSADSDGDGIPNDQDICPGGDDNVDTDGDFVPDFCDPCPVDPDNDADGDGVCGDLDICPSGDDNLDADLDGTPDECDVCPHDSNNDADGDGVCGNIDNCPLDTNSNQLDTDDDLIGDACDPDDDGDGICDGATSGFGCSAGPDNCPLLFNPGQIDTDGDGIGDLCDIDSDNDGVVDVADSCPLTSIGETVNGDGCSVSDLCPCDGIWKNHGAHVRCVAHTSEDFLAAALITEAEKDSIVSSAAHSACGAKK